MGRDSREVTSGNKRTVLPVSVEKKERKEKKRKQRKERERVNECTK